MSERMVSGDAGEPTGIDEGGTRQTTISAPTGVDENGGSPPPPPTTSLYPRTVVY